MIAAHSAFFSMSRGGGLLHVEDLPADRQQRLVLGVARQLGGAQRRVTLDDEQLAALDVVAAAVGQLGRQRRGLQRVLAPLQLLVRPRRDPGPGRGGDLVQDRLGLHLAALLGVVSSAFSSLPTTDATIRVAAEVPSTSLVWPSNCGSASRTVTIAVMPSRTSSLTTSSSAARSTRWAPQRLVERLGQRPLEPLDVGAALGRRDDVDERPHRRVVARPPPQRHVHGELALDLLRGHVPLVVEHRHGLAEVPDTLQPEHVADGLVGSEELAELADATVVPERRRPPRPARARRGRRG